MSHLSLALLGTPEVRYAGRIVKFRTRKEQALLIYLAVEGGLHSREKITALFWPDSDEPQGRTSLRRTLADLRRTLEDAGGATHLIIERDLLGFAIAGAAAAAANTVEPEPAAAEPVDLGGKRKARYQANSSEVKNFYRVNRYPAQ